MISTAHRSDSLQFEIFLSGGLTAQFREWVLNPQSFEKSSVTGTWGAGETARRFAARRQHPRHATRHARARGAVHGWIHQGRQGTGLGGISGTENSSSRQPQRHRRGASERRAAARGDEQAGHRQGERPQRGVVGVVVVVDGVMEVVGGLLDAVARVVDGG